MRKGRFMKYLFKYRYLTLEFEDLDDQLRKYINLFEDEFKGLNISVPKRENTVYEEDEDIMTQTPDEIRKFEEEVKKNNDNCRKNNDNENKIDDLDKNLNIDVSNNVVNNSVNTKNDVSNNDINKETDSKEKQNNDNDFNYENQENEEKDIKIETSDEKIMKILFRRISKKTHPDRNSDENVIYYFKKAKKALSEQNISELLFIADKFDIDIKDLIEKIDTTKIESDIEKLNNKIKSLTDTIVWKYYTSDVNVQDSIRKHLYSQMGQ